MALYGVAARELTDRAIYLNEISGRPFAPADATAKAVIGALERALLAAAIHAPIDPLAPRFARAAAHPRARIATLAADLGCSERSLRHFAGLHIGLSPKTAARVARLHNVLATSLPQADPSWTALALAAGYADQAHLIRETRELLGETPRRYWARGR